MWFWFLQLHLFLQMLKKSFVEMKKETTIQVEYFINDFTSYTQKFKKKRCNRRFNSKNIPNYPKYIIYSSFK